MAQPLDNNPAFDPNVELNDDTVEVIVPLGPTVASSKVTIPKGVKITTLRNELKVERKKIRTAQTFKNALMKDYESYKVKMESCVCLLYTSPSPRDLSTSRMPSSA